MIYLLMLLQWYTPSGVIYGVVNDDMYDAVAFVNVVVYQDTNFITATETDIDGQYTINLAPGTYNIEINSIGYRVQRVERVIVKDKDQIELKSILEEDWVLDEVVMSGCVRLINLDASETDSTLKASEVQNLPVKDISELVGSTSGLSTYRDDMDIKGSREKATLFILDGVRVPGTLPSGPIIKEESLMDMPRDWENSLIPASGILTAGEINDFSKWELWTDISTNELSRYAQKWALLPEDRYTVQLKDDVGNPIVNQEVTLRASDDELVWTARTDNYGRAELWANLFDNSNDGKLSIATIIDEKMHRIKKAKKINKRINYLTIYQSCHATHKVDIAFLVDATSSLTDEIDYLKNDLTTVISSVKELDERLNIHVASVFYRDHGDEYLTRQTDFTSDINQVNQFILKQSSDGGGDSPEAVEEGLQVALEGLSWRSDAQTRLLLLILDAAPHDHSEVKAKLKSQIRLAAKMGIRIIPVVASGIDKSDEYLMRSIALATNGTYLFLTDHSGVGGEHIKPTTDEYSVQRLNDLLVNTIGQFAIVAECIDEEVLAGIMEGPMDPIEDATIKTTNVTPGGDEVTWSYYPNPTAGIVQIESSHEGGELFLMDVTGKLLERHSLENQRKFKFDLSNLPPGNYILKYLRNGIWKTGQLMVVPNI